MPDEPCATAALRPAPPHRCWYRQQHTIGCVMSGTNGRGCACPTQSVCRLCAEPKRDVTGITPDSARSVRRD